jgi:DNA/RNA endonuclease YhcR with UshA esterase domain
MRTLNDYFLTVQLTDVSAPSSVSVVAPDDGNIVEIFSVLGGAITVANSAVITKINGTTVTGGGFTVAYSGSAAGDVDSAEPTALNAVKEGDYITITSDGGSTTTQPITVTLVIRR